MGQRKKDQGHWSDGREKKAAVATTENELSHYGRHGIYYEEPRWDKEKSLSMSQGRLSADEMWFRMVRGSRTAPSGSEVRIFDVVDLVSATYLVVESPTLGNDLHASVSAPLDPSASAEEHRVWWDRPDRIQLSALTKEVISVQG